MNNIIESVIEKTKNNKLDWKESVYKERYYATIHQNQFDSLTFFISREQKGELQQTSFWVTDSVGSTIWGKTTETGSGSSELTFNNELRLLFDIVSRVVYNNNKNAQQIVESALKDL